MDKGFGHPRPLPAKHGTEKLAEFGRGHNLINIIQAR